MSKLTLNSNKASLLTKDEMQELTGGVLTEEMGSENDCNNICENDYECQIQCHSCKVIPNRITLKACC